MKRVLIIKNEIAEISRLVVFIEPIGEEMGLSCRRIGHFSYKKDNEGN